MASTESSSLLTRATVAKLEQQDGSRSARYTGRLDGQWNIGSVPNGGYTLGTALHCAQDFIIRVRGAQHGHLLLSSATYLSKISHERSYVVDVRVIKQGRTTTNMEADLLQSSNKGGDALDLCIRVQITFADFEAMRSDASLAPLTVAPGDKGGARFPVKYADPNKADNLPSWFKQQDTPRVLIDQRAIDEAKQDGQMITAKYMYWPKADVQAKDVARHNISTVAMFCDMTSDMIPMLIGDARKALEEKGRRDGLWFPTLTLSIEMRRPLPTIALHRLAASARIKHLTFGQWNFEVELWSHPADAAHFGIAPTDKEQSVLLAVSQQTALTYGIAQQKSRSGRAKL